MAHKQYPLTPILGACAQSDVFRIVRFMANGLTAYVIRDSGGDYVFMLQSILESTVEAVRAVRDQELAEKLREEIESVRKLQASVIPKHLEAPTGYQLCGRYEPSQIRVFGGQPVTICARYRSPPGWASLPGSRSALTTKLGAPLRVRSSPPMGTPPS